jgi:hypothetical protein
MPKRPRDSESEFTAQKRRKADDALGYSSEEDAESAALKKYHTMITLWDDFALFL